MRIRFNTTWQEDEEERRQFYSSLTYGELLKVFVRSRKLFNFHPDKKRYDRFNFSDSKLPPCPYKA